MYRQLSGVLVYPAFGGLPCQTIKYLSLTYQTDHYPSVTRWSSGTQTVAKSIQNLAGNLSKIQQL